MTTLRGKGSMEGVLMHLMVLSDFSLLSGLPRPLRLDEMLCGIVS